MSDLDQRVSDAAERAGQEERGAVRQLFRIAPAVIVVLGIAAIVGARSLPFGKLTAPGAGLWPVVVASVAVVSAGLLVFLDIPDDYERWTGRSALVAAGIAVLGGFILAFQIVGFLVSAFGLLVVWLRLFARESWVLSLALAVVGAIGLHLIFVELFAVPFPESVLIPTIGGR